MTHNSNSANIMPRHEEAGGLVESRNQAEAAAQFIQNRLNTITGRNEAMKQRRIFGIKGRNVQNAHLSQGRIAKPLPVTSPKAPEQQAPVVLTAGASDQGASSQSLSPAGQPVRSR